VHKATQLRKLIDQGKIVVAPGVFDALGARIVERAGFQAVSITGNGVSAALLGKPDVGLLTMTEIVEQGHRIASAVDIPVVADADTGYGSALNVIRTVQEFEAAGIAGIAIEDQEAPKRCGHMAGARRLISTEEMVGKLEAAIWARKDPDFIIMARTDAAKTEGLEAAIKRGRAYADAGADIINVHTTGGREPLKAIGEGLNMPLKVNMDEAGEASLVPLGELEAMGYRLATYPGTLRYTVVWAAMKALAELKASGSTNSARDRMVSFQEYNEILGLPAIQQLDDRFVHRG